MSRKLLILLLLLSICVGSFAAGLKLFSYQNSEGQTIIVDRIERVPEQFRDQVTTGFISSYRQPKKAHTANSSASKASAPPPINNNHSSKSPTRTNITIIQPPPNIEEDPEVIKASSVTTSIRELSSRLEKTYGLAASIGLTSPHVSQLNIINIRELQNMTPPASVNWEEAKAWKVQATQIIPQMRTMLLTVNRAIELNSTQVLSEIPDYITRLNHRIKQLENMLKHAKEEFQARLAQD